jgi:ribosome-binding factor A
MAGRRVPRLNEQLKREIVDVLHHDVRDPRVGLATVTAVETNQDLSFARVYVTTLEEGEERQQMLQGLTAAAPFIRSELGRRLHIRRVPELRFELDKSLEYAMRIERLLHEVHGAEGPAAAPPEAESPPAGEGAPDEDDEAEDRDA